MEWDIGTQPLAREYQSVGDPTDQVSGSPDSCVPSSPQRRAGHPEMRQVQGRAVRRVATREATRYATMEAMDAYDTSQLADLGRRRRKLNRELKDNRRDLVPEVVAAARAKVPQARIVELSGYAREQVRRICREAGIAADD